MSFVGYCNDKEQSGDIIDELLVYRNTRLSYIQILVMSGHVGTGSPDIHNNDADTYISNNNGNDNNSNSNDNNYHNIMIDVSSHDSAL